MTRQCRRPPGVARHPPHLERALQLAGAARSCDQRVPHRRVGGDACRPSILHQAKGPLQQHQLLAPARAARKAQWRSTLSAVLRPAVVRSAGSGAHTHTHTRTNTRTRTHSPSRLSPNPSPGPAHRSEGGSRLMCSAQALTTEAYTILSEGTPAAFISQYSWKALSASPAPAQAAARASMLGKA